jgi:hypothetical protein
MFFQFALGIVLGVLITLSITSRFQSPSGSSSSKSGVADEKTATLRTDSTQTNIETPAALKASEISKATEVEKAWSPGQDGFLLKLKQKVDPANLVPLVTLTEEKSPDAKETTIPTTTATTAKSALGSSDGANSATSSKAKVAPKFGDAETQGGRARNKRNQNSIKKSYLDEDDDIKQSKLDAVTTSTVIPAAVTKAVDNPLGFDVFDKKTGIRGKGDSSKDELLYPPNQAYHDQATKLPLLPPYAPSLDSATLAKEHPVYGKQISKPLPNMTLQKAPFEKENLKIHLCNGVFEAYSASYLTTKEHLLAVKSERYNLSWVNCEMASFTHMRDSPNFYVNPNGHGMIMQVRR